MKPTALIFLLSVVVVACASGAADPEAGPGPAAAAAPAELDPAGSYTFSTTVQGMAVDGRLRITGSGGAWGGSMYTDVTGELPLTSVRVEGQELRLTADTPDGTVHVRVMFTGDTFTGAWNLGADGGPLTGRRVEG